MIDKDFYKNSGPFSLHDLAKNLKVEFVGDGGKVIDDIATIDCALNNEITFLTITSMRKILKSQMLAQ